MALHELDVSSLRNLIKAGADTEKADSNGLTPLTLAIQKGNFRQVELLIEAGVSLEAKTIHGETPVEYARKLQKDAIERFLLETIAAQKKDPGRKIVKGWGALQSRVFVFGTVLFWLSSNFVFGQETSGFKDCQNLLSDPPNTQNKFGETPLMTAARKGDMEKVQALGETGAPMDIQNIQGQTALTIAAEKGDGKILGFLIQAGANIHIRDDYGRTALMMAAWGGHPEAVDFLIQAGDPHGNKKQSGANGPVPGGPLGAMWKLWALSSKTGPTSILKTVMDIQL